MMTDLLEALKAGIEAELSNRSIDAQVCNIVQDLVYNAICVDCIRVTARNIFFDLFMDGDLIMKSHYNLGHSGSHNIIGTNSFDISDPLLFELIIDKITVRIDRIAARLKM